MKIFLIQATFTPVFQVVDEGGRTMRTFSPPDQNWQVYHSDLAGLKDRVEKFEAQMTAELAQQEERGSEGEPRASRATLMPIGANGRLPKGAPAPEACSKETS